MSLRAIFSPYALVSKVFSRYRQSNTANGNTNAIIPLSQPTLNFDTFAHHLNAIVGMTSTLNGILALPSEQLPMFDIQWGGIKRFALAQESPMATAVDPMSFIPRPIAASTRKISIIILTWNGIDLTRRCLQTLRQNTRHTNFDVWVVDNGSSDGTVEYLRSLPWIHRIENQTNRGFAQGNNQAIRACDSESDIVLLNNDVEIHQYDWLERLQQTAYSAVDTGIVGCRLRRPSGLLQHTGAYMPLDSFWGQQIAAGEEDIGQHTQDRRVEAVVFACAYFKREVIQRVGFLDERYFAYFEDSDYCLNAHDHGFRTVCCGGVTLDHHENASTRINGIVHGELFHQSQAIFRSKWEKKLHQTRYPHKIGWRSTINLPTGYGNSSRDLVLAMDRVGVEVAYRYLYGHGTPMPLYEPQHCEIDLLNRIRMRPLEPGGVQVVFGQGDVFDRNNGSYRIGYTMLETDGFPRDWVENANRMDEIWVPSTFNVRTMRDSGVTRPIHLMPLGVDPHYFHPAIKGQRHPNVFTFLSVFEWGERKAPEILLRAFTDEFRQSEDVVLVLKVINRDEEVDVRQQITQLRLARHGGRVILSCNDLIPNYQRGCLYRSADCLVLASRGEGWGMPALEAMACGLPVIATNWSAMTDFIDESVGYPLAVDRLVPAEAKCPYYQGFRWAEPSYDHLRTLLRYTFEHPKEGRSRGMHAAQIAKERWTWDHTATRIVERLCHITQQASPVHE